MSNNCIIIIFLSFVSHTLITPSNAIPSKIISGSYILNISSNEYTLHGSEL